MSTIATESEKKKTLSLVSSFPAVVEFLVVCVLSVAVSYAHLYICKGPNLTLLFDGFGFLTTASGCMSVWNGDSLTQIVSYCASAFDGNVRLKLVEVLAPAKEIVRTGPLLPLLLGCAYTLAGKAPVPQFWSVATWSMWLTQALTIGTIWLACRIAFNTTVARLAALIAILYPAFILNGNRIASETQACLALTLATAMFLYYAKNEFRNTQKFRNGLVCGLILGFLALARPPFVLLPVLLVVAISVVAVKLKVRIPLARRWICGVVCGGVLFLAPWALCNQILTGKPSITIDRFALYNLYTGLTTSSQGFDVLPGRFVEHPGEFQVELPKVLGAISEEAGKNPQGFFTMMSLKPVRLLDSPWNDYQVSCMGVPWLVQRYFHQVLLALAMIGLFALWNRGISQRTVASLSTPIVFTLVVVYNFIHCLFISMARYSYPIMPIIIILAAWGISAVSLARRRGLIVPALIMAPLPSLVIEGTSLPPNTLMPNLAIGLGMDVFVALFATLPALGFLLFAASAVSMIDASRKLKLIYSGVSVTIAFLITIASDYGLRQLAFPLDANAEKIKVAIPINDHKLSTVPPCCWLVLVDPLLGGFSLDSISACRVAVNGTQLTGSLYPFIGADRLQRSSFVYEKAFAHSGQRDVTEIRQWYCMAVPPALVKNEKDNIVEVWKDASSRNTSLHVMSDLLDSSKESSTVSLRKFSWSKGFTINPPLDMRMSEHAPADLTSLELNPNIRPRISLVLVETVDNHGRPYMEQIGDVTSISLPDQTLTKQQKVVSLAVPAEQLSDLIGNVRRGSGNAIYLRVSGNCKADSDAGKVSVALVTNTNVSGRANETMSPLAPEFIRCGPSGRKFSFVDIIPVSTTPDKDFTLSTRIVAGGQAWWDVLQYGSYKLDAPMSLSQFKVEASLTTLPNFDMANWQPKQFRCRPVRKP